MEQLQQEQNIVCFWIENPEFTQNVSSPKLVKGKCKESVHCYYQINWRKHPTFLLQLLNVEVYSEFLNDLSKDRFRMTIQLILNNSDFNRFRNEGTESPCL